MEHAPVMIMANTRCSVDPLSGKAAGSPRDRGGAGMTAAESKTHPAQPKAKRAAAQPYRPPWMEAMVADWRERWPAAFTKPLPLAAGFNGQMRAALRADGKLEDRKSFGVAVHAWTMQGAHLYAVMRGERRRNLDGSEAELPTEEARQEAKSMLAERAARRATREQAKQQTAAASRDGTNAPALSASDSET
jgi:hypothetical protein